MKTLIIYASNSGSTYLAGQAIQETLTNNGNDVVLKHAKDSMPNDLIDCDLVIFGSPSWKVNNLEGQPHEFILELLSKLTSAELSGKNVAFYGCGDRAYLRFCGAVDEMEKMLSDKNITKVSESLKIDSFYFDLDNNIEKIRAWAGSLTKSLVTSLV